jgi:hypothetical protein
VQTAADALPRDESNARRLVLHLAQRLVVRRKIELGDETQPTYEPQRVFREGALGHGAQNPVVQILLPAERIDELRIGEAPRDRVHGEVASREIVLHRR